MIDNLPASLSQIRGEIMHEFSKIEYYVRSALAHFLTSQKRRTSEKYREQLGRFSKFIAQRPIEWNSKILRNPDVHLSSAEIMAADERTFGNCLPRLERAAAKANYPKISKLRSLLEEIEAATVQRNLLTHSVWIELPEKIVMQNFPDYHKSKWMFIDKDGERHTPEPSPEWTFQELQNFNANLRHLSQRLMNLFQNQG
jgi:hypothetical protein